MKYSASPLVLFVVVSLAFIYFAPTLLGGLYVKRKWLKNANKICTIRLPRNLWLGILALAVVARVPEFQLPALLLSA